MKKNIIVLGAVLVSCSLFSQMGINTVSPGATLDVQVKDSKNPQSLDGLIAPRLLGSELSAKTYTLAQEGAIVYIKDSSAVLSGQTINVNGAGYYYFDGTVWKRMLTTVANNGWQLEDTAQNSRINQRTYVTQFGGDTGLDSQPILNSELTVTVPSGYSKNKVVLRWDLWGTSKPLDLLKIAQGTFRYFIDQKSSNNVTTEISSIMMNGWVIAPGYHDGEGPRWSTPVVYTTTNLPPGTYTFTLKIIRGDEINMLPSNTPKYALTDVSIWGIQSNADVYVK